MTVGYGAIVPQNEYEALFASITIIFGCGLYAFNLNSIGMIVQNTFQKENQFRKDLRVINSFMDRKKVDAKLQRRVQEYLNFLWDEKNADNRDEEIAIINSLSETLREELFLESYGGNFLNHPMFVQNFTCSPTKKFAPQWEINLGKTGDSDQEQTRKEKSILVFETMKNFKNYFPKMN